MSALRLLLVTDAVGGVWVYSLELARALRPLGIETILALVGPSPADRQREEAFDFQLVDTGLPLEWLDTSPSEIAAASHALARLADDQRADIVQTCSAALLAAGSFGQPCVAVQHSCVASWWAAVKAASLNEQFKWRRDFVEEGLRRADAVVAPTIAFAAETSRLYGIATAAVYNGRTPMQSRELPQGEFVFTAGRLWDEGKNVVTLDTAAALTDVPFQAAGAVLGPNRVHIGLNHVTTLGPLSKARLAALYAARPVYASAAVYEPFGLSVLEAAQAGCALVLSDIPTHRELWNGAAIFVPPCDAMAFASAVESLIKDHAKRDEHGRLAAARSTHYSPGRMARSMADLYARVRSRKPIALAGAA